MHIKYIYKYIQHIHTIYSFEIIVKNLQIQCTNNLQFYNVKQELTLHIFFLSNSILISWQSYGEKIFGEKKKL